MAKQRPQLDSAHPIVGGWQKLELQNRKNQDVLACRTRTSDAMMKRTPPLDSAHRIAGGCQKLDFKSYENQKRFGLWNENQQCYGQTDARAGFSASNSWGMPEIGF